MAEAVRSNPKILQDPKYGAPPQIQPVYGGGTVKGFRVLNVQSGSIYSSLGIQTGDTIVDVNGQIVDNPQKALSFFDQLGPGADVAVKINRKGRLKTLTYQLQ
ncbi:MAG: PDZ domain-containing protein, partial [Myxococcota bacterium]|jgi:type II secretory pathway component PulC|nr:PDZ domain-containing protein [Myxococcota bacterium]